MYFIRQSSEGVPIELAPPSGFVLDVDGTLIEDNPGIYEESRMAAARVIGAAIGSEYLEKITLGISQRAYAEATEHSTIGSLANLLHMAGLTDTPHIDHTNELLRAFVARREEIHLGLLESQARLNPGVKDLLRYGRDCTEYGVAIATTATREELEIICDKFELGKCGVEMSRAVTSRETFNTKPFAEPFRVAAKALLPSSMKRHEEETAIAGMWGVDDSPLGILSAHDARLTAIGFGGRGDARSLIAETPADVAVDSLPDIIILAKSLQRSAVRAQ